MSYFLFKVFGSVIDIFPINNYIGEFDYRNAFSNELNHKLGATFIICTYNEIYFFTYLNDHFLSKKIFIGNSNIKTKITCGTAVRINANNPNLVAHAEEHEKTTLIITGHRNGQVKL